MNPLTLVKRIKEINSKEAALGISEDASWHSKYKESPYVFVGGIPFDLTEGDLLAVFSQYGEIVDVNLVRDKGTGKSKGFAFVAYEDQRSTNLAVDNLNGASVLGRIIRVDHVTKYKKKEEEDEEMEQQKREARGVCRAFQRGDCNRGASCKFSHNEQRAANTGWGPKDDIPKWGHDKHEAPPIKSGGNSSSRIGDRHDKGDNTQSDDKGRRLSRTEDDMDHRDIYPKRRERDHESRVVEKPSEISEKEPCFKDSDRQAKSRNDWDQGKRNERSFRYESDQTPNVNHDRKERPGRYESEPKSREDHDGESHNKPREDHDRKERSGRHESESKRREGRDRTGREDRSGRQSERNKIDDNDQRDAIKRSRYDEGSSSRHHREEDELQARRAWR